MATNSLYIFSKQSVVVLIIIIIALYLSLSADSISLKVDKSKLQSQDNTFTFDTLHYGNVSHIFYNGVLPIWDSKTRDLFDFSTHFQITADTLNEAKYGGGMAFFFAPISLRTTTPSLNAGYLGLYNDLTYTSSSLNQIVHVEFDIGLESWDPSFQHVGINVNSITSSVYTRWYAGLHSGDFLDVWITYDSITKLLSVSWSYLLTSVSYEKTTLSYFVDLRDVLPPQATMGFSAANSKYVQQISLLSWEFQYQLNSKTTSTIYDNGNWRDVEANLAVGVMVSVGLVLILLAII